MPEVWYGSGFVKLLQDMTEADWREVDETIARFKIWLGQKTAAMRAMPNPRYW